MAELIRERDSREFSERDAKGCCTAVRERHIIRKRRVDRAYKS